MQRDDEEPDVLELDLALPTDVRSDARFERPMEPNVRETRLLNDLPWVDFPASLSAGGIRWKLLNVAPELGSWAAMVGGAPACGAWTSASAKVARPRVPVRAKSWVRGVIVGSVWSVGVPRLGESGDEAGPRDVATCGAADHRRFARGDP